MRVHFPAYAESHSRAGLHLSFVEKVSSSIRFDRLRQVRTLTEFAHDFNSARERLRFVFICSDIAGTTRAERLPALSSNTRTRTSGRLHGVTLTAAGIQTTFNDCERLFIVSLFLIS